MTRLRILGLVVPAVALAVLGSMASAGSGNRLDRLSNPGTAAKLPDEVASFVEQRGISSGLRLLGVRGGTAFYIGRPTGGSGECFVMTAASDSGRRPEIYGCRSQTFASAGQPVVDLSLRRSPTDDPETVYIDVLRGYAADGVATVSLVDRLGERRSAPVEDNIYELRNPSDEPAVRIEARDAEGNVVWAKDLAPGK